MSQPNDDFIAPVCHHPVEILYQDEAILVINKPSGLLSLSGKNPLNQDSVHFRLRQQIPHCLMVHRLDFPTSGLMVLALSKSVNAKLTQQFQQRLIEKHYVAMLEGHISPESAVIDAAIAKHRFPLMKICQHSGKAARSDYALIAHLHEPARSLVLFKPQTGRTHQLRLHSLHIGHPILGCDLYASASSEDKAERLLLHASYLRFIHPLTQQPIAFHSPCPFLE